MAWFSLIDIILIELYMLFVWQKCGSCNLRLVYLCSNLTLWQRKRKYIFRVDRCRYFWIFVCANTYHSWVLNVVFGSTCTFVVVSKRVSDTVFEKLHDYMLLYVGMFLQANNNVLRLSHLSWRSKFEVWSYEDITQLIVLWAEKYLHNFKLRTSIFSLDDWA